MTAATAVKKQGGGAGAGFIAGFALRTTLG
jgi:hypothetical protein